MIHIYLYEKWRKTLSVMTTTFFLGMDTEKLFDYMRKRVRIYRKQMKRFTGGTHTHTFTHKDEEKEYKVATIFVTTPYDDVINEVLNGLRSPISLFFSATVCWLPFLQTSTSIHVPTFPFVFIVSPRKAKKNVKGLDDFFPVQIKDKSKSNSWS